MFSGWYAVSLDEKGRVAVPASFRHALAKTDAGPLYLTPFSHDGKPHLEVFPSAEFARLAEQIQNLEDSEQAELLKQEIIGRSVAVELDGQGRIVRLTGRPVDLEKIAEGERWAYDNDTVMSVIQAEPPDAGITAGRWWPADYAGPPVVAMEQDAARARRMVRNSSSMSG